MPKTISPIRKRMVKRELMNGNSARSALKTANYSEGHIRRSTANKIVKDSIKEIEEELRTEGKVTKEWVEDLVKQILNEAYKKKDYSNSLRGMELISRLAGLLIDKKEIKTIDTDTLFNEYKANRLKNYDE